jgi:hypothetical protein
VRITGYSGPFSRNVVLVELLFSINLVPKPQMLSVPAVYVLSSLHLEGEDIKLHLFAIRVLEDEVRYEVKLSGDPEHKTVKPPVWLSLLHDRLARTVAKIPTLGPPKSNRRNWPAPSNLFLSDSYLGGKERRTDCRR